MEFTLLLVAFIFGFICKLINLPALIGFLIAGFVLHAMGYTSDPNLDTIADLGITVMLFTIGLKLNIRDLVKTEVWFSSVSHLTLWVCMSVALIFLLITMGVPYFVGLSLAQAAIIGFAFSFSSTVCVVKILDEAGESRTRHGKIAIGMLVMQDIFAVLFLALASGEMPSVYALGLFALIPLAPLLRKLLEESGHGELLPLGGLFFALGGYYLFELVGVKGDLGALIIGVLLAKSSKSAELSKSLLAFKDLFLVGFFLSIGLSALPTFTMIILAALITLLLIPVKYALFFGIFAACKLRVRSSYLSSLIMSNYSEFGLIVIAVAVSLGMLSPDWLVIMALSASFSFTLSSVIYKHSHEYYARVKHKLRNYQRAVVLPEDRSPQMPKAEIIVIGLGRVGKGAFATLTAALGSKVWGMDADAEKVARMQSDGKQVIVGDGENIDLWDKLDLSNIKLVLLALPSSEDSANITYQLNLANFGGKIVAIARYKDEEEALLSKGVHKVFNFYNDAGLGFAEESIALLTRD